MKRMGIDFAMGKLKHRGRRVTGYWARYGDLESHGASPQLAAENLECLIRAQVKYSNFLTVHFALKGYVGFAYRGLETWCYTLVDPQGKGVEASGYNSLDEAAKTLCATHRAKSLPRDCPRYVAAPNHSQGV